MQTYEFDISIFVKHPQRIDCCVIYASTFNRTHLLIIHVLIKTSPHKNFAVICVYSFWSEMEN